MQAKFKNSIDGEIFNVLVHTTSEFEIISSKRSGGAGGSSDHDKTMNFATGKREALVRENVVIKAVGKEKDNKEGDEKEEKKEEEKEEEGGGAGGEGETEQFFHQGTAVILSTKGELGTLQENLALLGFRNRTHAGQEGDEEMEEEEFGDKGEGGKEISKMKECRYPKKGESPCFPLVEAGPTGIDNEVHQTGDPSGSKNKMRPIKIEREDVKINMPQVDLQDDNFHSKDLLCFAWQIAKGMVSNFIGETPVTSSV